MEIISLYHVLFSVLANQTRLEISSQVVLYKLQKKNQVVRIKYTNFSKGASRFYK